MTVSEILDLRIQRQANVLAILWRLDRADILDDLSTPVLDHAAATRVPEQLVLKGKLHALQPLVIDAGEADKVRSHFAGRIVAAEFAVLPDAGQLQRRDFFTDFRRQLPAQEYERLVAGQPLRQFLRIHIQNTGQLLCLLLRKTHIRRNGPDRFHRRGYGQDVAVAISDAPARGGNLQIAAIARLALFLQKVFVQHLQIE